VTTTANVIDVDVDTFEEAVIAASHERPVVVDFWAAWCGPCRQLTPMLERAVAAQDGRVLLAKVDVDANPALAQRYRVQGIPQVVGFRDGTAIAQFTGVQPEPQLAAFIEDLLPTEADQAVARARSATGRRPSPNSSGPSSSTRATVRPRSGWPSCCGATTRDGRWR
jgi:putative thioredoxin